MEIIFATANLHKLQEGQQILGERFLLKTPADFGITENIPETSDTLKGNAIQKAMYVWERLHKPCFADDTGLEVDCLNGAPGVYSARYAGPGKDSSDNMRKLLSQMSGEKERSARFRCVVALIIDGKVTLFNGVCEGVITFSPTGMGGFGYDPVFKPAGFDKCFSELSSDEKNAVSHRGKAMRLLADYLNKL